MSSPDTPSPKRWYKYLLKPSWLAGIISVGFHSALFASGPTFTGLNFKTLVEPEPFDQRQVPLIELSAAEQARLPDFSNAFYNFDTFNSLDFSDGSVLGQRPELSVEPESGNSAAGSEFSGGAFPNPVLERTFTLPPPITLSPPPTDTGSRLPEVTTPATDPEVADSTAAEGELPVLPERSEPVALGDPPEVTDGASDGDEETPEKEPGAADLAREPANPETAVANPDPPLEEIPETQTATDRVRAQFQAYVYDETGTTDEAAASRLEMWLEEGETLANTLEIPADAEVEPIEDPIEIFFEYGQRPCLSEDPHGGLIAVWLSPEGALGDPVLVKSTGYPFINQQALEVISQQAVEIVQTQESEAIGPLAGYQFAINVDYDSDVCIDLRRAKDRSSSDIPAAEPDLESSPEKAPEPPAESDPSAE